MNYLRDKADDVNGRVRMYVEKEKDVFHSRARRLIRTDPSDAESLRSKNSCCNSAFNLTSNVSYAEQGISAFRFANKTEPSKILTDFWPIGPSYWQVPDVSNLFSK